MIGGDKTMGVMVTRQREKSQNGICAMEKIHKMPDRVNDGIKKPCMIEKEKKKRVWREREVQCGQLMETRNPIRER
jgi:hypothetical protein